MLGMSFLLDTNICSAALKHDRRVFPRFVQHAGRLFTSRIVWAELYAWAYRVNDPSGRLQAIDGLLNEVVMLEFDEKCCDRYGKLKEFLHRSGITVAPLDLLIAATALANGCLMVTHDAHFALIPNLSVVDWLTP
jgi:tRNA(fMet)-specific endonuclease VapC